MYASTHNTRHVYLQIHTHTHTHTHTTPTYTNTHMHTHIHTYCWKVRYKCSTEDITSKATPKINNAYSEPTNMLLNIPQQEAMEDTSEDQMYPSTHNE